jgi:hypothetical protein
MSTGPSHTRGHGRIREVRCSCDVCRYAARAALAVRQRRADVGMVEQLREVAR